MITDVLEEKTKNIVDTDKQIKAYTESEYQRKIDTRYTRLVQAVALLVQNVSLLKSKTHFIISTSSYQQLADLLSNLSNASETGKVDDSVVAYNEKTYNKLNISLNNEWVDFYKDQTQGVIATLRLLVRIKPGEASNLIQQIESGKSWDDPVQSKITMFEGISNAREMISNLEMGPGIIDFLKNISSNKATLGDLTDEVMLWIRQEKLETRIHLSFTE